jgi:hypothetical protein
MAKKTKEQIKQEMRRLAKRMSDRNYRFRLMDPKAKRVRIAKDVIQDLETERLFAANSGYFKLGKPTAEYNVYSTTTIPRAQGAKAKAFKKALYEEETEVPLHQVLDGLSCTVCAIGACFVAAVERADGLAAKDFDEEPESMRDYLSSWFSMEQLGLIEAAFEKSAGYAENQGCSWHSASLAARFGMDYDDPTARMIAIMKNIVDNDGTFCP